MWQIKQVKQVLKKIKTLGSIVSAKGQVKEGKLYFVAIEVKSTSLYLFDDYYYQQILHYLALLEKKLNIDTELVYHTSSI